MMTTDEYSKAIASLMGKVKPVPAQGQSEDAYKAGPRPAAAVMGSQVDQAGPYRANPSTDPNRGNDPDEEEEDEDDGI